MTKDINQIQEYNRKKIICAVHNTDDYEEALRLEVNHNHTTKINNHLYNYISGEKITNKPITLDRVLLALETNNQDSEVKAYGIVGNMIICYKESADMDIICNWDLTKTTLEEQSEETQRAIFKLLGGKNE